MQEQIQHQYFFTPSPNRLRKLQQKSDYQQSEGTTADQYIALQRSIIQKNRSKLKFLLQQKNKLLGIQPNTSQKSPISKYSIRKNIQLNKDKPSKFSVSSYKKEQDTEKVNQINSGEQLKYKVKNQDQNLILQKISNRVKGMIHNQSQKKPVYFTKDKNNEQNHIIRNLIQENNQLTSISQEYQITEIQKNKKIQQLTKQLNQLKILYQQKQQSFHKSISIKDTQMQNLQKFYKFQIKSIKEHFDDSIQAFWKNILNSIDKINFKSIILDKRLSKLNNVSSLFKKNFKVQKQLFNDAIHRKVKNISQISPSITGDIQLDQPILQKQEFQQKIQQLQRKKMNFQAQIAEYQIKYLQLHKGFQQLKQKNMILLNEIQNLKLNGNANFKQQIKISETISTQTQFKNEEKKVNISCNTIKIEPNQEKKSKKLEQEISLVKEQLQMLTKYFIQEIQNIQQKQHLHHQSLIENFKKKPTQKQLSMVQNLAKKQRKEKNMAYIKLASLQKQLQQQKKKNQIYEQQLSNQIQGIAEQFNEQQKKANIPDGLAALQWQKVVKHKLRTILQQIKQIENNQFKS